jgi:hypothetical protein
MSTRDAPELTFGQKRLRELRRQEEERNRIDFFRSQLEQSAPPSPPTPPSGVARSPTGVIRGSTGSPTSLPPTLAPSPTEVIRGSRGFETSAPDASVIRDLVLDRKSPEQVRAEQRAAGDFKDSLRRSVFDVGPMGSLEQERMEQRRGANFSKLTNAMSFPFAAFGGRMIDTFGEVKAAVTDPIGEVRDLRLPGLRELIPDPGAWWQEVKETVERQRLRPWWAQLASETVTPLEIGGLLQLSRLGLAKIPPAAGRISKVKKFTPSGAREAELAEFGLQLDSTANTFAAPLRPFDAVRSEVRVARNKLEQQITRGINPSMSRTTEVGKIATAYQRQMVAAEELTGTAVAGAWDIHQGQIHALIPIDKDGFFQGKQWQDVFSKPDSFDLTEAQRLAIDEYNHITNVEIPRLLDDAGIDLHLSARPDNEYYVPRDVQEIRGIETRRHSDPNLQRHYDEATAGFEAGIRYDTDPRRSLEFHLRSTYRQIVKKQMNDALEDFSLTAKQIVPKEIRDSYARALRSRRELEAFRRNIRLGIVTADAHTRIQAMALTGRGKALTITQDDIAKLDEFLQELDTFLPVDRDFTTFELIDLGRIKQAKEELRKIKRRERVQGMRVASAETRLASIEARRDMLDSILENVDIQLAHARRTHTQTRNTYVRAMEEARKAEISPGALWGPNQPDEIAIGMWRNRFFTREDADLLHDVIGAEAPKGITNFFNQLANTRRFLASVGDFAMPFIQGQGVLVENPVSWGKMSLRHHQAFFDPQVQSRLIRDNITDYQWLAQHGVPIGDPEFFSALQPGQGFSFQRLFGKLPKGDEFQRFMQMAGRQSFGRFQASYNTGLGWGRVLLLKGLRDGWKGTDAELAQYIRNLTGGLDSRALGIGPKQRAVEATWMAFSPRFLRSTIALVKDAMNPSTPQGRRALRALAVWSTGATSIYVTTAMALGKDWKDIEAGLNPLNGKRYLSHQINGDWIGVGGQIRALMQLIATATVHPDRLLSVDRRTNPLIRFALGRGAQGPEMIGALVEFATGGDVDLLPFEQIDGRMDLLKHTGTAHAPFALQGYLDGEGALANVAGLLGARTSAETPYDRRNAARQSAMDELGFAGQDFREDLDVIKRGKVDDLVPQVIKDEIADFERNRRAPIQAFKDENDRDRDEFVRLEELAATEYGPSKAYRNRLTKIQEGLQEDLKDNRRDNPAAMQLIEEFEPSEHVRDQVLRDYIEAINDPAIENNLGEVDFDLLESNIQVVRDRHSEELVSEIQDFLRKNESPLQRELRRDRESLREFWEIADQAVERYFPEWMGDIYKIHQEDTPTKQTQNLFKYGDIINPISNLVREYQRIYWLANPDIRALLLKWEYRTARELQALEGTLVP